MRVGWVLACVIGEALGMALVASIYAGLARGLLSGEAVWTLVAGAGEGVALGGAQALAFRRYRARTARPSLPLWVGLTMVVAMLGYAGALTTRLGGGGENAALAGAAPPLWAIGLMGAAMGAVLGPLFGAAQGLALRKAHGISRAAWVLANLVGWMAAMPVIMLAASLVGQDWPLWRIALAGAGAGAGAGALIGASTSLALGKTARP